MSASAWKRRDKMADKKGRIAQLVFKDISDIILNDEFKCDLTSLACINEVKMNIDNTVATVFVTHLDPNKVDDLMKFLDDNRGRIRSALAKRLDIYKVPQIVFKKDDLFDKGQRIDMILEEAQKPEMTLKDLDKIKKPRKTTKKKTTKKAVAKKTK